MTSTDVAVNSRSSSRFVQLIGRGRTLLIVAVTEVVLFVIANITYGNGKDNHGAMRTLSNVVWAIFLVGFLVLIVVAIVTVARLIMNRAKTRV
jgi:energy-converting hydrogenase Eha subunit G